MKSAINFLEQRRKTLINVEEGFSAQFKKSNGAEKDNLYSKIKKLRERIINIDNAMIILEYESTENDEEDYSEMLIEMEDQE